MLFRLAFRNVFSRRSSIVIILFMAFAAMLLSVANAVFDSTEHGVESSFIHSFTGDFIIRPVSDVPLSLFGDETPVTGELTELGTIVPYSEVVSMVQALPTVAQSVPQVSGVAIMEFGGNRMPVSVFGVCGTEYISMMDAVHIVQGNPYISGDKGMMLSDKLATQLGVKPGDVVQFTVADGPTFRIRAVPVAAVFSYAVENSIFDRFVLVDPDTVRSLMGITGTVTSDIELDDSKTSLLADDLDIMSLFDSAGDVDAIFEEEAYEGLAAEELPGDWASTEEINSAESTTWNFIICRLSADAAPKKTISMLNRTFRKNQWPVEAVNWRHAAGSTALYLYWMRIIFNAGILIVLAAGFIVVNNTLTINVLDRTQEIGTLRAVGGTRLFVSLQCMVETFTMAIIAAVVGCLLGWVATEFLSALKITFSNSFLIQLFGSAALEIQMTLKNVLRIFVLMLFLGMLGWIYPVKAVLRVSPLQAMHEAK